MIGKQTAYKLLQAAVVIGFACSGLGAASAQTNGGSMAGMKMGPAAKTSTAAKKVSSKKPAPKKAAHMHGAHDGAHHDGASKAK